MKPNLISALKLRTFFLPLCLAVVAGCDDSINVPIQPGGGDGDGGGGSDGPADQGPPLPARTDGDLALGRTVFR
ncbi:MAG: hypothetical protein WKF55_15580, partial [Gemmatimonadaceae bacterium]